MEGVLYKWTNYLTGQRARVPGGGVGIDGERRGPPEGLCGEAAEKEGQGPFRLLAVTLAENGLPWLPGLNPSLRPLLELASAGDGSRLRTFLAVGSVPDHFFPRVIMLISSPGFGNNFQSHCVCGCNLHPYPHLILHFVNN